LDNVKYTQVAAKAVSLAELFEARFEQGLDGPVRFRVELSAPDGPSTAGGKQAMQHIKLIPPDGAATIVIGSANTTRQMAEIRTFEHVAELYAQRYHGARIPVEVLRYRELSQGLEAFFKAMRLTVTFAELERAPGTPPFKLAEPGGGNRGLIIGLGVTIALLVLALAYIFIFLHRR
jgi:translation initiation factor IF-2